MRVYIIEQSEYETWLKAIRYEAEDPKGPSMKGVKYLRCADAGNAFPNNILRLEVYDDETVSHVIRRATGEQPSLFLKEDIEKELQNDREKLTSRFHNVDEKKIVALAVSRLNLSLLKPPDDVFSGYNRPLPTQSSIAKERIDNGDIVLIKRHSIKQVIEDCLKKVLDEGRKESALGGLNLHTVMPLRNSQEFFKKLGYLDDVGTLMSGERALVNERRPQIAILYTDEDTHVASYVRTHFDSLDKASGNDCDVLFIENPKSVAPYKYWSNFLDEIGLLIWQSLGWTKSKPYNKSEIYYIAKKLNIPLDSLPCAVVFEKTFAKEVFRLENDLTSSFRELFAKFQKLEADITISPSKEAEKSICFMSHKSKDKSIVRRVASSLHTFGIETWFDEWEILPGDSITKKIEEGLKKASHLVLFLSEASINSKWVLEEMNVALYHAISSAKVKVIPVVLENCEIPMIISSYAQIVESDPRTIAERIRQSVLGVTRKPPIRIQA